MKLIRYFPIVIALALVGITTPRVYMNKQDEESPRMKCLKRCQAEHLTCLTNAGSDQSKKSACKKAVSACEKGCPKP